MTTVVRVNPGTELLTMIKELWRRHSSTLGFFPDGAFEDYAVNRSIIAATDDNGRLLGYTLFRTTHRQKASIAHLCVDPAARGQGVARVLFDAVRRAVGHCSDITVRCRRDFDANSLWPRLGFVPVGEDKGRGKSADVITIWRHELYRLPLLEAMEQRSDDRILVAIDANIFFDLDDHINTVPHEESKALIADWLGEFVELCVTVEIYNEIDRNKDHRQRTRQRSRIEHFRLLPSDNTRAEQVIAELQLLFPKWKSDSGNSDIRQLALTIAGGATIFATRDNLVRDQADELYERYGLLIVSPFELVLRFDELRRENEYRPKRFIASGLKHMRPRTGDLLEKIVDMLHAGQPSVEPRRRTLARLRDIAASPELYDLNCICDSDDATLAAYAIDRRTPGVLQIPLFVVADSALGRTSARHLIGIIIKLGVLEGRRLVLVKEEAGGRRIEEALAEAGFSKHGDTWVKIALPLVGSPTELAAELDKISEERAEARSLAGQVAQHLRAADSESPRQLARLERALWPSKIIGTNLPCYIVPIRPIWAGNLFDAELAEYDLFGADPKLMMNWENAYYRSAQPAILTAPSRVLWYVSQDDDHPGSMAIRACSYIDEVIVASPKEAFKKFQRLGVYTWTEVFKIANKDLEKQLMVFQFSGTERLQPIPWAKLQDVLKRESGKGSQLQSPLQITETCFFTLYKLGRGDT